MEEQHDYISTSKAKYLENNNSFSSIENPPSGSIFWNGLMGTTNCSQIITYSKKRHIRQSIIKYIRSHPI